MKMPCKFPSFVVPGHRTSERWHKHDIARRDEPGHDGLICPPLLPDLKLSV